MKYTEPWLIPQPETTDEPNGALQMTEMGDVINAALSVANGDTTPRAWGYANADMGTTTSVPQNTRVALPMSKVVFDTTNMYSTEGNTFTITADGIYLADLSAYWVVGSTARTTTVWVMVGATLDTATAYGSDTRQNITGNCYQHSSILMPLFAGETMWFAVYQNGSTSTIRGNTLGLAQVAPMPEGVTARAVRSPFTVAFEAEG